jgi:uncharacterized protein YdhG (YjbR/CyaY superfamily)
MPSSTPGAKQSAADAKKGETFTAEERAAMKERAKELRAEARAGKDRAAGESALLAKIAELQEPDRSICERLHALISANAPALLPKTWYGMPAYANIEGKVVLFFRDRQKFKERYMTLGFNEEANLDEGALWPIAFALTELNAAEETAIAGLVRKAVR